MAYILLKSLNGLVAKLCILFLAVGVVFIQLYILFYKLVLGPAHEDTVLVAHRKIFWKVLSVKLLVLN